MSLLGVSCKKMHCHLKGNDDDAKKVSLKIIWQAIKMKQIIQLNS